MSGADDQRPVVVASVQTLADAESICRDLEAEGIVAAINDEHMGTMYAGWLTSSLGGVKVVVPASQAERAEALLAPPPPEPPSAGELCEQRVEWAFTFALLGIGFPGASLVALGLLVAAVRAPGKLRPELRRRAWCAFALAVAATAMWIWAFPRFL